MLTLVLGEGVFEVFAGVVGDAFGGEGEIFDADLPSLGEDADASKVEPVRKWGAAETRRMGLRLNC